MSVWQADPSNPSNCAGVCRKRHIKQPKEKQRKSVLSSDVDPAAIAIRKSQAKTPSSKTHRQIPGATGIYGHSLTGVDPEAMTASHGFYWLWQQDSSLSTRVYHQTSASAHSC